MAGSESLNDQLLWSHEFIIDSNLVNPIIVILTVVIVAASAYWFGVRTFSPTFHSPQAPAEVGRRSPTASTIATEDVGDTTDWKTYINSAYEYSLNYPSKWVIKVYHQATDKNTVSFASPDLEYSGDSGYPSYGAMVNIDSEKTTLRDLEELLAKISSDRFRQIHSKSYLVVDQVRALRLVENGLEAPTGVDVYIIKGDRLYTAQFWEIGTSYSDVFDRMLSTFHFME